MACFAAGTRLWTPSGYRAIESIAAGERVYSKDESDPAGGVEAKVVEEVFRRYAPVDELALAGGRVIRTTREHPFFAGGKGWVACRELEPGDRVSVCDGGWVEVVEVRATGAWEVVYNLRVADWHTYFVGKQEWGFSVWAHNAYTEVASTAQIVMFATQNAALTMAMSIGGIPKSLQPTHIYRFVDGTIGLGTVKDHGVPVTTLQATDFESGEWMEFYVPGVGYRYIIHHPRPAQAGGQTMGVGHYHVGQPKESGIHARLVPTDPNRNRYKNMFDGVKWEHIAYERQ